MSGDEVESGDAPSEQEGSESPHGTSDETTPESVGRRGPPTPVRAMMGEPGDDSEGMSLDERPSREFEVDDETWIACTLGRTRSGAASDSGAPLLLVGFRRSDGPERLEREAMAVCDSLQELSGIELEDLFARSRPFRPLPDPENRKERRTSPVSKDLRTKGRD